MSYFRIITQSCTTEWAFYTHWPQWDLIYVQSKLEPCDQPPPVYMRHKNGNSCHGVGRVIRTVVSIPRMRMERWDEMRDEGRGHLPRDELQVCLALVLVAAAREQDTRRRRRQKRRLAQRSVDASVVVVVVAVALAAAAAAAALCETSCVFGTGEQVVKMKLKLNMCARPATASTTAAAAGGARWRTLTSTLSDVRVCQYMLFSVCVRVCVCEFGALFTLAERAAGGGASRGANIAVGFVHGNWPSSLS